MFSQASLSQKLMRIGAAMLVVALASIGLTLWVTWKLEGGAAAVNEAGRMRMQTWRLASTVQAAHTSQEVATLVQQFDDSLGVLQSGDPGRPLFVPDHPDVGRKFAQVQALWQQQRVRWLAQPPMPAQEAMDAAGHFVEAIDGLVLAIEQQLARLTAVLNLFQFVMMALAIGGAVVMLYTGYLYVISPLAQLRQGLHKLEAGEFATRIRVDTQDEFGQVAAGFNRMAATLQSLYQGLESKVEAKTRHIEAQHARLQTLYEVSAFLGQANSIEAMSQGFAQRVRSFLQADAAVVRWSDEANQRYLMLATDAFPSALVERERCLLEGTCLCGSSAPALHTRVIPILPQGEREVLHCAELGYQSVVSVPIRLHQRLLGEFNLFYRQPARLSSDEVELLDALASHLAGALEGLRADALQREAAVGEERALLASELHDSIAQSLAFLKIQVQLLRSAVERAQPERVQTGLDELDTGLRESISDVRELLVHFRTRTNTDDIEQALQETLQKFQQQTTIPAHLQSHGEGLPLAPDVQVQVLHVVQEALSNVRKHARASHVVLEVAKGPQWRFVVRDNGVGFDAQVQADSSHVGMKIMQERAQRIGASVRVAAQPGQGTRVTLTLPPHPTPQGAAPARPTQETPHVR